jgi:hypothetical protein
LQKRGLLKMAKTGVDLSGLHQCAPKNDMRDRLMGVFLQGFNHMRSEPPGRSDIGRLDLRSFGAPWLISGEERRKSATRGKVKLALRIRNLGWSKRPPEA